MSLIDVILGQKIIPLTIGLAVLLILMAVVLMIVPRIRKHRAKVAQERAERIAAAAEAAQEEAESELIQVRTSPKKPATAASSAAAVVPPAAKPAAAAVLAASPQTTGQPQAGETAPSAMQDILSSVFSDEDNSERQAALMRGMSDVDMNDLLTLTQQVVVQLHGGKTVTVVKDKELQ